MTSSFVFGSASEAAARFRDESPGNVYSRFTNPTVRVFEQRLAALEEGAHCVATASGMAAVLNTCMTLLSAGDHVVASRALFGSTIGLFNKILKRFGISTSYVPLAALAAWEAAITPQTKLLFAESPSNPLGEVVDLRALAELAHQHGCRLVVDNVACTPALQQPLELGADVVVHSATKYIDGQGRAVGGAIVTNEKDLSDGFFSFNRTAGPSLSPFNAWIFVNGLETLRLRMHAHSANALRLAQWLEQHPAIARVHYPGLPSNPAYPIATSQQTAFGGVVAFDIKGGQQQAWEVIDATQLLSITANLGDTKTTITHPATTTHGRLEEQERIAMGVRQSLLRVAVGLENIDNVMDDLERGLNRIALRESPSHRTIASNNNRCAGDITPEEAWQVLTEDLCAQLIDVRTEAEWSYVGAPDLDGIGREAIRLSWKHFPKMDVNPDFVSTLQNRIADTNAPLLFLCRSGIRSRDAAIAMTDAGFTQCYNIAQGFEGDQDEAKHRGLRSGWKAAGLPWRQS